MISINNYISSPSWMADRDKCLFCGEVGKLSTQNKSFYIIECDCWRKNTELKYCRSYYLKEYCGSNIEIILNKIYYFFTFHKSDKRCDCTLFAQYENGTVRELATFPPEIINPANAYDKLQKYLVFI